MAHGFPCATALLAPRDGDRSALPCQYPYGQTIALRIAADIFAAHNFGGGMRKSLLILAVVTAACGDPKTTDHRGYTKAPLEQPDVFVKGEPHTPISNLGHPNYPDAPLIEPEKDQKSNMPESGAKGAAAQQQSKAPAAPAGRPPAGATAADVAAGETIFSSTGNCFTCHGQGGVGTAMAPALNDSKWIHIDGSWASIQQIVNSGVPQPKEHPAPMPAKGGAALTDQQVRQVAAYVYSLSH